MFSKNDLLYIGNDGSNSKDKTFCTSVQSVQFIEISETENTP